MLLRYPLEQVNAFLFHKQRLAAPAIGQGVAELIAQVGPFRGAPPATPYLSLWARSADFRPADLDAALYEQRRLLRVPAMHSRLHLVPAADWPAHRAVMDSLWLNDLAELAAYPHGQLGQAVPEDRLRSGPDLTIDDVVRRILEVLGTRGPGTIEDLAAYLPELERRIYHDPDEPDLGYSRLGTRLLPALCARGTLVRAQPRGGWRSESYTYAALSQWLPAPLDAEIDRAQALRRVITGYLRAFGPATVGDLHNWLGGLSRREVAAAVLELGSAVERVQIAGMSGEFLLLADEVEALAAFESGERAVALLPAHDHYPVAYIDTSRFLDPLQREQVFDRVGEPTGTVWLDGAVAGIWWLQWRDERIVARLFEAVDPEGLALVGEKARALAEFLAFATLDIDIGPLDQEDEEIQVPIAGAYAAGEIAGIVLTPQGD